MPIALIHKLSKTEINDVLSYVQAGLAKHERDIFIDKIHASSTPGENLDCYKKFPSSIIDEYMRSDYQQQWLKTEETRAAAELADITKLVKKQNPELKEKDKKLDAKIEIAKQNYLSQAYKSHLSLIKRGEAVAIADRDDLMLEHFAKKAKKPDVQAFLRSEQESYAKQAKTLSTLNTIIERVEGRPHCTTADFRRWAMLFAKQEDKEIEEAVTKLKIGVKRQERSEHYEEKAEVAGLILRTIGFTLTIAGLVMGEHLGELFENTEFGVDELEESAETSSALLTGLILCLKGEYKAAAAPLAVGTVLAATQVLKAVTTFGPHFMSAASMPALGLVGAACSFGMAAYFHHQYKEAQTRVETMDSQIVAIDDFQSIDKKLEALLAKAKKIQQTLQSDKPLKEKNQAQTDLEAIRLQLCNKCDEMDTNINTLLSPIENRIKSLTEKKNTLEEEKQTLNELPDSPSKTERMTHLEQEQAILQAKINDAQQRKDNLNSLKQTSMDRVKTTLTLLNKSNLDFDLTKAGKETPKAEQDALKNAQTQLDELATQKDLKIQPIREDLVSDRSILDKIARSERAQALKCKGNRNSSIKGGVILATMAVLSVVAASVATMGVLPIVVAALSGALLAAKVAAKIYEKKTAPMKLKQSEAAINSLDEMLKNSDEIENKTGVDIKQKLTFDKNEKPMSFEQYIDQLIIKNPAKAVKVLDAFKKVQDNCTPDNIQAFKAALSAKENKLDFFHEPTGAKLFKQMESAMMEKTDGDTDTDHEVAHI